MDTYDKVCAELSRSITQQYSTSFTSASRLFPKEMRIHIYNIYGLVRIADEIVDSYRGPDRAAQLDALEQEAYAATKRRFSVNPIVHAFAITANDYGIGQDLLQPFFDSMRMDIHPTPYNQKQYEQYIYGSAEVIGLMCLKVFCSKDTAEYTQLKPGARRLGAAYQKVNFLRDFKDDYLELGRVYFPGTTFESFDDKAKDHIIADIKKDFAYAAEYITKLPPSARPAVAASCRYYRELLNKLADTPAAIIKQRRIRLPNSRKAVLLAPYLLGARR